MQCVTNLPSICETCGAIVRNFSYVYTRLYSIMVKNGPILFVCCFARADKWIWRSHVILEKLRSLSCSRNFHLFTEHEVYCGVHRSPSVGSILFRNRSVHSPLLWHWATVPFTFYQVAPSLHSLRLKCWRHHLPHSCYVSTNLILLVLIPQIKYGRDLKTRSSLLCSSFPSLLSDPNFFYNI